MDSDQGPEPFELTKQFCDLAPGTFPAFSLLTAFGQAAPFNRELQRDGRVLPFPFHFLDNNHAMNVRPKNYAWPEFYDHVVDLSRHAFSWPMIAKRVMLSRGWIPTWFNFIRSVSSEGFGRIKYHTKIRGLLDTNVSVRNFLEGETSELPKFYARKIRGKLGPLYDLLPEGATMHDHHAYLKSYQEPIPPLVALDPLPKVGSATIEEEGGTALSHSSVSVCFAASCSFVFPPPGVKTSCKSRKSPSQGFDILCSHNISVWL